MAKLTLTDILGQYASTTELNNNFALIETALENTISRDGTTPNTMSADLDMNSNSLNNVQNLNSLDISSMSELADAIVYSEEWANKAEDSLVSVAAGGDGSTEYSSLHWAAKSSDSASAALTSETNAAASYDSFDDRYLGAKASDPTLDNDGDALLTGAMYWNTSSNDLRFYSGSTWAIASTLTNNDAGTVAPTVSNDNTENYAIGSFWVDTVLNEYYVCLDASIGAAIWEKTTTDYTDSIVDVNSVANNLVKLIHPDESKGLQDLQRQGIFPVSFTQQGASIMGFGLVLPDGSISEVSASSLSLDGTVTTINATNVNRAFKVGKTMEIAGVVVRIRKTSNLTSNTIVTINSVAYNIPEKTITDGATGELIFCPIVTTLTSNTSYNINMATTGNAIEWFDDNGNYAHGGGSQFIIIPSSSDSILQSGLSGFDGALHCYEGAPLDQSGAFYFANTELNHKRGLIHFAGTGFTKDKTIYDSGLGTDNNRIVIRTNVTTGYAQVDLYENDENKLTVTGITDISTSNHIVSVGYRAEGDGSDFLKLYIDGASEGTPLTSQTITLDRSFEDGHSTVGGGFPLAPTWTKNFDMSTLPSVDADTAFSGSATESNVFVVNGGVLYQDAAGYASTDTGQYIVSTSLNNATGWVTEFEFDMETLIAATSKEGEIRIQDGTKELRFELSTYFFGIVSTDMYYAQVDLTKKVTLRITGKGSDYRVDIDNKLIFDGTGLLIAATATNDVRWGDAESGSGANATIRWHSVKIYAGEFLPEYSDVQISEAAIWNDDKSSLLSTIYNSGSIQPIKALAGMNESYVNTVKQVIEVKGITLSPTTTSTSLIPLDDMNIFTFGEHLDIEFTGTFKVATAPNRALMDFSVDGKFHGLRIGHPAGNALEFNIANNGRKKVYSSLHYTQCFWYVNASTGTANKTQRNLSVEAN